MRSNYKIESVARLIRELSLLFVVYSFAHCTTLKQSVNAPFTITEATYQKWVGVNPEMHGIKLSFCIEALNGASIQHVYYANAKHTPNIATRKGNTYVLVNSSNSHSDAIEALTLASNKKYPDKSFAIKKEFPFALKINEAVITYTRGTKIRHYKVSQIKKLATIFYP